MAGYQFLHIEAFAHEASKLAGTKPSKAGQKRALAQTKAGTVIADGHGRIDGVGRGGHKSAETRAWSAREVLAEALREAGACGHVENPQAPELMLGDPRQLATMLDEYKRPKGVRKDTPLVIAGVASAPWPPGDERSIEWRMDVMAWLKKTYGTDLRCVIAHNDEAHDHLHFYVYNPDLKPVKSLHHGMKARQAAADAGEPSATQKQAFTKAMQAVQDDFFVAVSEIHGMARKGPGRKRLSRAEWSSEQAQLEELAEILKRKKHATNQLNETNAKVVAANIRAEAAERIAQQEQDKCTALAARVEAAEAQLVKVKAERDSTIQNAKSGWERAIADARTRADEIIAKAKETAKALESENQAKQKLLDQLIVRNQEIHAGLEGLARQQADELIKRVMMKPK